MKFPLRWLNDYVKTGGRVEDLARKLTAAGFEVSTISKDGGGEPVLELEILANRPDCLSVIGLSREISVLLGKKLTLPPPKISQKGPKIGGLISIEVKAKELCPRYMARVIESVTVGPSPAWIKERLEAAGVRSINNIVDVTNFVLLEAGQPLHAFDLELIKGAHVTIRRPKQEEKIITLDGIERSLGDGHLLIADAERPVALAGVMGAVNTEIRQGTTRVLLESAYFDPQSINRTSRGLKLRTESSVRFEEGVDWEGVEKALDRAAQLILELAGGTIAAGRIDIRGKKPAPQKISLSAAKMKGYLGTWTAAAAVKKILGGLGCAVSVRGSDEKAVYQCKIPSHRLNDLQQDVDLIEEIARIQGYDAIRSAPPDALPPILARDFPPKDSAPKLAAFRERLLGLGLTEVMTSSLSAPQIQKLFPPRAGRMIQIDNPLTPEESVLRVSLLPGLIQSLKYNLNRQRSSFHAFEIGRVFNRNASGKNIENLKLAGLIYGSAVTEPWREPSREVSDFYSAKSIIEAIHGLFGLEMDWTPADCPRFHPMKSLAFKVGPGSSAIVGTAGALHPNIQAALELPEGIVAFELYLEPLTARAAKPFRVLPVPVTPAIRRDINVGLQPEQTDECVRKLIHDSAGPFLEEITLIDKYPPAGQGRGVKLTYRLSYRNPDGSLTDEEVNRYHAVVVHALEKGRPV